jgi:hypothetical protein
MSHFFDGDVKLLVVNEENLKYIAVKELEVGQKLKTVSSSTTLLEIKEEEKECYLIKPCKAENFLLPKDCSLALRSSGYKRKAYGTEYDMTIDSEDLSSKWGQKRFKLFRKPLLWNEKSYDITPYFLGYWITKSTSPTLLRVHKKEVLERLKNEANKCSINFELIQIMPIILEGFVDPLSRQKKNLKHPSIMIKGAWEDYVKDQEWHHSFYIPQQYLIGSIEQRNQLLSGILDGVGYLGIDSGIYDVSLVNEVFLEQIELLAKSLGFYVTYKNEKRKTKEAVKIKKRIYISGELQTLQCSDPNKIFVREDRATKANVTGFEYENKGNQKVYSLQLKDENEHVISSDHLIMSNKIENVGNRV